MDITDRKLLNKIQGPFPMVAQPFQELGEEVGIGEQEVLDRLTELKRTNVLRQIRSCEHSIEESSLGHRFHDAERLW